MKVTLGLTILSSELEIQCIGQASTKKLNI